LSIGLWITIGEGWRILQNNMLEVEMKKCLNAVIICICILVSGCTNEENEVVINVDDIPSDEISMICGTYLGENQSVLLVYADGTAAYYYDGYSNVGDSDDVWMFKDGILTWYSYKMHCNITNDYTEYDYENSDSLSYKMYMFKSDSLNWTDEYYVKISDSIEAMTDDDCKELIASFSFPRVLSEQEANNLRYEKEKKMNEQFSIAKGLVEAYNAKHSDSPVTGDNVIKRENGAGPEIHLYKNDIEIIVSFGEYHNAYCIITTVEDEEYFIEEASEWANAILDYEEIEYNEEDVEKDIRDMVDNPYVNSDFGYDDDAWMCKKGGSHPWIGDYTYFLGNSFK